MNKCLGCGKCCSNYLPLTDIEYKKLWSIVKQNKLKPTLHLTERYPESVCPFLDKDNRCVIYEDRPSICSSYTCKKFYKKDFSGLNNKEKYTLYDLRKNIF